MSDVRPKINPKIRKLLEWMDGKVVLESQIVSSGLSRPLNEALINGWANLTDTSVKERSGVPAAAYTITPKGKAALSASAEGSA